MSIFVLKIIALITMFIDHFAYLNLPFSDSTYNILREIGRISFPLYIFILTEGLYYTKNRLLMIKNLFIFALISQIPFYLYFGQNFYNLNVLFTMLFGSIIVCNIDNLRENYSKNNLWLLNLSLFLPVLFRTDYDIFGTFSIVILYYLKRIPFKNKYYKNVLPAIFLTLMLTFFNYGNGILYIVIGSTASLLVLFYNHSEGLKYKKFFYLAYPVHITFYYIINLLIL